MIRPTFKTPDFRRVIAELQDVAEDVQDELRLEIKDTAHFIVMKAKGAAPVNESQLVNSISKKELTEYQWEVVANSKYAAFMEFGTRRLVSIPPGAEEIAAEARAEYRKGPKGTIEEMEKSIRRWVRLKGIVGTFSVKTRRRTKRNKAEEAREDSMVFLIMKKLLKVGVKPQPFFYPAIEEGTKDFVKRLTTIINKKR